MKQPVRRPVLALVVVALVMAACGGAASSPTAPSNGAPTTALPSPTTPSPPTVEPPSAPPESPAPSVATPSPVVTPAPTPAPPLAWRSIAGDGPAAREDHTWTVVGDTAYLFGGRDGRRVFGDLWAYDLAADRWQRVEPRGPAPDPRFGHEAIHVPGQGIVIFAGQAGPTEFFGDLWVLDPATATWRELPTRGSAPVARYGSCLALGPDGRLVISHGFTEDLTRFADTRAYDLAAGRWADVTPSGRPPVARCLHGCWVLPDGRLALYAGQTTGVAALGDLWTLDLRAGGGRWARADVALPPDRNLYARATLADGRTIVFGGQGIDRRYLADLHAVDPVTLAFTPLAPEGAGPRGRSGAELIADPDRSRLLLFGGKDGRGALGDLWSLPIPGTG